MIMISGATGVVGGRLVIELLQSTSLHLVLLIRKKELVSSYARLEQILQAYESGFRIDDWLDRFTILDADLSKENLGLTVAEVERLSGQVDVVIHAAAKTDLVTTPSAAKAGNVLTTQNMLKFAAAIGHPLFCMISSYSIFGDWLFKENVTMTEAHFDVGQRFHRMPYQESKFLSESEVRKSDLPWMIIRLGQVFGDLVTSSYPLLPSVKPGFFNNFVGLIARSGIAPISSYRFDITPVDFVARGIFTLLGNGSPGVTYHLCHPSPPTLIDLADWLEEEGYSMQRISVPEYISLFRDGALFATDRVHRTTATATLNLWFKNPVINFTSDAQICSARTMKLLAKENVHFPQILPSHLASYIRDMDRKIGLAVGIDALGT